MRVPSALLAFTACLTSLALFGPTRTEARQVSGSGHSGVRVQQLIHGTAYINKTARFALTVPNGWKVNDYIPRTTPSAVGALVSPDGRAGVMIQEYRYRLSTEQSKQILERGFSRQFRGYQKIKDVSLTINGKRAEGFVFGFQQPEVRAGREVIFSGKMLVVLFPHGVNILGIMCEAPSTDFDRLENTFEKIAASYRPLTP